MALAVLQSEYGQIMFLECSIERSVFFFFFQAEDGIRDLTVTGVQTCALPISCSRARPVLSSIIASAAGTMGAMSRAASPRRSEEHTSELQSQSNLVCRLLLEKKKKTIFIRAERLSSLLTN